MKVMSSTQKPELAPSSASSGAGYPAQRHLVAPQLASSLARQGVERELLSAANDALVSKTEELQQQREWFEVTLASIGDGVITTDAEGRITYLNPIAETLTGWRSTDAAGLPAEQVFRIIAEGVQQPVNPLPSTIARLLFAMPKATSSARWSCYVMSVRHALPR
jgi:PAS domain-containing protein